MHDCAAERAKREIDDFLARGWTPQGDRVVDPENPAFWVAFDPHTFDRTESPDYAAAMNKLMEEADRAAARARQLLSQRRR
jgi:hypothetical protein